MKRILTVVFLMITIYGFGQVPPNYLNIRSRYNLIAIKSDSGFHVPGYSTIPNIRGGVWNGSGNIGIDTVNNKFYFYSGGDWREAGSTLDTTSLSNRIDQKLNIADTANIRARLYAGTNITISGTYPNLTIASTAAGGADSSVFATLYRVDTAKANLRSSIAGKVSGSGTDLRLALWNGTNTITSHQRYTYANSDWYPNLTIGSGSGVCYGASLSFKDVAGTLASITNDGGPLSIYGSSTYKSINLYDYAGGAGALARFYSATSTKYVDLYGLVTASTLSVPSNEQGAYTIQRTVPYAPTGNNYHGYTDQTDFRVGNEAFNSFGSFVKFGNNRTTQNHYAAFQAVWQKDSSNTMGKVYDFVSAVSAMKGGQIDTLYRFKVYDATVTGGTILKQYGIHIQALTSATTNIGAYIQDNVGIGTESPFEKLTVSGNIYTSGTVQTGAPTDGTSRTWKLGDYVTTAPSATGYVQVEINGTKYKVLAATY